VLSIHLGSLGFLCPFDYENYKEYIDGVMKGNAPILLRNRLRCKLERLSDQQKIEELHHTSLELEEIRFSESQPLEWLSLNEIVIGRGPSPYLSNLDLYVNDYLITTVQGDGLIISTPTGSTAYAMAAGASICHPSVPAIVIAPICPHSLSFRPIVVPADVQLRISLSVESRSTAWYSVDGRFTNELKHGYEITITTSNYPLKSICRSDQTNDWFEGLATCLHWNQRQKQLPLNQCFLQTQSSYTNSSISSKSSLSTNTDLLHNSNINNLTSKDTKQVKHISYSSTPIEARKSKNDDRQVNNHEMKFDLDFEY
jgi:NAD+ kinase